MGIGGQSQPVARVVVSAYGVRVDRRGFDIDTPVGKYNPDWAIVKQNGQALYLVRETKATRDFLKLRTSEADKVYCGQRHFEALGVPFGVVVSAAEV